MDISIAKSAMVAIDNKYGNIIKTRDDQDLIVFNQNEELIEQCVCHWLEETDGKSIFPNNTILRDRIEPWLTALFQSEHLNLLCGSGLSSAVSFAAGCNGGATMAKAEFSVFRDEITKCAKIKAKCAGRDEGNIEDQIRTAIELLRGLEIQGSDKAFSLQTDLNNILDAFSQSILRAENDIANADSAKRNDALNILVNFLLSFASRSGSRERLNVFTTN